MSLLPFALAVALAATPVAAAPTVHLHADPAVVAPGCEVTDATLTWGFKESFRAYIDGDIANGEWTTADGATYETPDFTWTGGTGRYDPATGLGGIAFTGSVRFTGHDGVLDTTIADPYIRFDGTTGALLLDVSGPTMEGDDVDLQDVEFLSLATTLVVGEDAVRTVDSTTTLTEDGAVAFPNYPAGEAFDPVSLAMTVGKNCSVAASGGDVVEPGDAGAAIWPVVVIVIGSALVGAMIIVLFYVTRRRADA